MITREFSLQGTYLGRPVIVEEGLVENTAGDLNTLHEHEHEDMQLVRVRRATGLTAKSLDGETITPITIRDSVIGTFSQCVQIEMTDIRRFAPRQPFGRFAGKEILSYQRRWVDLG